MPIKLKTDKGGEFIGPLIRNFCAAHGIQPVFTTTESSASNGRAERAIRTLVEKTRCLLIWSGLPMYLWPFAMQTSAYIKNRLPTSSQSGKTPYQKFFKKKPSYEHLRTFGCLCFYREFEDKLSPISRPAVFVGYGTTNTHYRVYDPNKKSAIVVRDIKFDETTPGSSLFSFKVTDYGKYFPFNHEADLLIPKERPDPLSTLHPLSVPLTFFNNKLTHQSEASSSSLKEPESLTLSSHDSAENRTSSTNASPSPQSPRRSTRSTKGNRYEAVMKTIHSNLAQFEPKNITQALENEDWKRSAVDELNSIKEQQVFELVQRPANTNVIGSKWVFKNKVDQNGIIVRIKTRLVTQGYTQIE